MLRWEIQAKNSKYFDRFKNPIPLTIQQLCTPKFFTLLAQNATKIYHDSIKMQRLNLYKLSTHGKRVVATMLNPEIRDDLKIHNKETYKRDTGEFLKQIIADVHICINDETVELLMEKFRQLITGNPTFQEQCKSRGPLVI